MAEYTWYILILLSTVCFTDFPLFMSNHEVTDGLSIAWSKSAGALLVAALAISLDPPRRSTCWIMERHGAYRHIVAYRLRDRGKKKTEKTPDLLKRCGPLREFHILHNMLTENIAYFSENVGSEPERCRKAARFRPYAKAFASCNTQLQVDWCGWLDEVNWFAQTAGTTKQKIV